MPRQKTASILCAKCLDAPADPACALLVTAFGVGNVMIYLCPADYAAIRSTQQNAHSLEIEHEQQRQDFERTREQAEKSALLHYGGKWPDREQIWEQLRQTEDRFLEARQIYRQTDDASLEGQRARLVTLRLAGICLAEAICIEAVARQDQLEASAVSGTLVRVTFAITKQGLTIPAKQITKEQVIAAMLTILNYRETHGENEEAELDLLSAGGSAAQ